jgi:hypothetical protein
MEIEPIRTEGSDLAIEFRVVVQGCVTWNFAIVREFEESWGSAKLECDPQGGGIPLKAIIWAIEFSKNSL